MKRITYEDAGVNIAAGEEAVRRIEGHVALTHRPWVLSDIGPSFGGLVDLSLLGRWLRRRVLIESIDGVGTKTRIAEAMNKFNTIGICLVHHCANDLLTAGHVKLVSFLNYIGAHTLLPDIHEQIIIGMVQACRALSCPIVGGEMAEMPSVYQKGGHEIVGQMTGIVKRRKIINGSAITPGNVVIGLASSGLHTNGYTLARRVLFEEQGLHVGSHFGGLRMELGQYLLEPHRCYFNPMLAVIDEGVKILGIAHITGGGIAGNLIRILPDDCRAVIDKKCWRPQRIFGVIQGNDWVEEDEMYHVFNMGIGMAVVVSASEADEAIERLAFHLRAQESDSSLDAEVYAFPIGRIENGEREVKLI